MDGNKPYIYCSVPVKDAEDNVIAVLVLALPKLGLPTIRK